MSYKMFIPVDGSDCSLHALRHAVSLAGNIADCSIHIAHAHEQPMIYGEIAVYVPREKIEQLQRAKSESVFASAEELLKTTGVPYSKEVVVGPVAQALVERAQALACDAIVMGTHGLTTLGRLLMGSVASKVIHLSDIPVTLVK
jgi:nucleotide-binding universal stress UspA family protein